MLFILCLNGFSTCWVAYVTTTVNLREGPSTEYGIITQIPINALVYYDSNDMSGDFVRVIYINKDISGYISLRYVVNKNKVNVDKSGQLQVVGTSYSYNPEISIKNKSDYTMTLRLNDDFYKFAPHTVKTIVVLPGNITITASSPGVIPYIGEDVVQSRNSYEWTFYVKTIKH